MKKILIAVALTGIMFSAFGQASIQYLHSRNSTSKSTGYKDVARDSVNSGTTVLAPTTSYVYAQSDSNTIIGTYKAAAIQINITKVSGTLAGSIYLQGSVDGTNWTNIEDTATISNAATYSYTWTTPHRLTVVASSVSKLYTNPTVLTYFYYRTYIAGTGTWCGTFSTGIVPRQ